MKARGKLWLSDVLSVNTFVSVPMTKPPAAVRCSVDLMIAAAVRYCPLVF